MLLSTLPDVTRRCQTLTGTENQDGGHQNRKWKKVNGLSLRPDFNGYSHICDHAGHVGDTADANRRWLFAGI